MNIYREPARNLAPRAETARSLTRASAICRLGEAAVAAASGGAGGLAWLRLPSRGCARAALLRQRAMYLCHVGLGVSLTDTGRALGRDRTTVRHGCMTVEDLRTQASQDQALTALEWGLRAQLGAWLGWAQPDREDRAHG